MTDTIEGRLVGDDESTADNVKYVPSPVRTVFVASGLDREAQARKDEFDLVHQPIAIEFWADTCQALQARIRALEAQAARDAKVREAARDYQAARDAYRKVAVTDIAGWPKACVEVGYRYERLRRTIDDALAEEVE